VAYKSPKRSETIMEKVAARTKIRAVLTRKVSDVSLALSRDGAARAGSVVGIGRTHGKS